MTPKFQVGDTIYYLLRDEYDEEVGNIIYDENRNSITLAVCQLQVGAVTITKTGVRYSEDLHSDIRVEQGNAFSREEIIEQFKKRFDQLC